MSAALAVEDDPALAEVLRLLHAARLPTADIGTGAGPKFFGIRDASNPATWLGVVGVECYGNEALLRSLTVSRAARQRGLGAKLVAAVEAWARKNGCRRVVLLTTDAQTYFGKLGYRPVARQSISTALADSSQVASVCPANATVMARDLPDN